MDDTKREVSDATSRKVCGVCGQAFDVADLDQVFHHDAGPHEPLED
ncbi:MAG: hypothetical protein ABL932_07995 [Terricaulis sp.]